MSVDVRVWQILCWQGDTKCTTTIDLNIFSCDWNIVCPWINHHNLPLCSVTVECCQQWSIWTTAVVFFTWSFIRHLMRELLLGEEFQWHAEACAAPPQPQTRPQVSVSKIISFPTRGWTAKAENPEVCIKLGVALNTMITLLCFWGTKKWVVELYTYKYFNNTLYQTNTSWNLYSSEWKKVIWKETPVSLENSKF